jgi:hypothetical protein
MQTTIGYIEVISQDQISKAYSRLQRNYITDRQFIPELLS